jgi:hypothetical protein
MLYVSEARLEFVRFPLVNYRCIGIDTVGGGGDWSLELRTGKFADCCIEPAAFGNNQCV